MDYARLERRIRALESARSASLRWGEVTEVDEGSGTARVKLRDADGMVSMPLRVRQSRTKNDQEQCLPDLGEQVGCLFSGQGLEEGLVLGAVYSTMHPSPARPPHVWYRKFSDGTEVEYDRESHQLTAIIKGSAAIEADLDVTIKSKQSLILEGATSIILRTPSLLIQGLLGKACAALMTATLKLKGLLEQEGSHQLTGDVNAGGSVLDNGSNTNHHSH